MTYDLHFDGLYWRFLRAFCAQLSSADTARFLMYSRRGFWFVFVVFNACWISIQSTDSEILSKPHGGIYVYMYVYAHPKCLSKFFYALPTLPPPRNCHKEIQKTIKEIRNKNTALTFFAVCGKNDLIYIWHNGLVDGVLQYTFIWVRYLRMRICICVCICVYLVATHITRSQSLALIHKT